MTEKRCCHLWKDRRQECIQVPMGAEGGEDAKGKDNQHNRDISSKTVFSNAVLCAQFLRDNFEMPILKKVKPEDIVDVTERYYPYLGTEFEADTVKRIRILDIGKEKGQEGHGCKEPPFLVSLIDHKSLVDYDVSMQLLRYMVCIWMEYRREMEAVQEGCTRRKGFRYPLILPIVYYEGKAEWTADIHLGDRIRDSGEYKEWIPDFQYEVVRLHDYSDKELLDRCDEMSLIMLINKIQDAADLKRFIHISGEELSRVIRDSPEQLVDIMASVMDSLCLKINVSAEERKQCVQKVKERKMGYLFENMEKIDIQEERRKTEEERRKTEEERRKAEEERKKRKEAQREAEEAQQVAKEERQKAEEAFRRAEETEQKLRAAEEIIRHLQAVLQEQ